jgi:hypothetical protein
LYKKRSAGVTLQANYAALIDSGGSLPKTFANSSETVPRRLRKALKRAVEADIGGPYKPAIAVKPVVTKPPSTTAYALTHTASSF